MPPMQPTSTNWRMADRLTGGHLASILTVKSAAGVSVRDIAADLYRDHGIEITHSTVASWLRILATPEHEPVA